MPSAGELIAAVEGSAFVQYVATAPLAYPFVSALHLFGIALVFGSIVPVDLRLLGVLGSQFDAALESLVRTAIVGFALAVPSGLVMASLRIADYAQNPAFLAKLAILVLAGGNALMLRFLSGTRSVRSVVGRPVGRIAATVSLCLWVGAVLAGRWIAFA